MQMEFERLSAVVKDQKSKEKLGFSKICTYNESSIDNFQLILIEWFLLNEQAIVAHWRELESELH